MNFASAGNGTTSHLSGELFRTMAGIDIVHIPYRGGGLAVTDLIGGQVQMMIDVMPNVYPLAKEGRIRGIAVSTADRGRGEPRPQTRSLAVARFNGDGTLDTSFGSGGWVVSDFGHFHQQGRKVFKDVVPLASKFIKEHLEAHGLSPAQIGRYWLHQSNQKLNEVVAEWVLGRVATRQEAPIILDEYGNTASAGSLIAFSLHSDDLAAGTHGVMCSFGAGYALGSLMLQRR